MRMEDKNKVIKMMKHSLLDMAFNDISRASNGGSKMGAFIFGEFALLIIWRGSTAAKSRTESTTNHRKSSLNTVITLP